jgi:hypothetical protein
MFPSRGLAYAGNGAQALSALVQPVDRHLARQLL